MLFSLLSSQIDAVTVITSLLVGITPLIVFWFTGFRDNKFRLIEKFNLIYQRTFSLRNDLSKICFRQYSIKEFYYENDLIFDCPDIKDYILDYLTEMEDLFFYAIRFKKLNNVFKKLMSFALYSRLVMFYGFIMKLRKINNDPTMFPNYVAVIKNIEKMKKIQRHIATHESIYYIGIRESEISYSSDFFDGCFAMFAKESAKYNLRPNQNKPCHEFFPYLENNYNNTTMGENDKYMTYNPTIAYGLAPKMQEKFVCLNDNALISSLNDKALCKTWLKQNDIPIIDFETKLGQSIVDDCELLLGKGQKFVLQSNNGGGGIGTFILSEHNLSDVKVLLNPIKKYLLSKYINNSISVNTHVFISEKQTVLSPASVQIIERHDNQLCYRGADYFAFNNISTKNKTQVKYLSLKIANLLRSRGYRGVAGIDFIISQNDDVYCSEINPRFQASSIILDKYLSLVEKENTISAHSIYDLNEQAFNNNMKTMLCFEDKIPYSCYYYYNDGLPIAYFENKINLLENLGVTIDKDGLEFDDKFDRDSYMFRAVFNHTISVISPDNELWINDNVRIVDPPYDALRLKIALLNQGVRINANSDFKKGVYESVDIILNSTKYGINNLDINCAVGINFSQYSPFTLNCNDNKLYYYGDILGEFKIESDLLKDFTEEERKILYIATDRLRIKCISGCEYKNRGLGCSFCNVPPSEKRFTPNDIINALDKLKQRGLPLRHILIGGGTCLSYNIWNDIITVATYLQNDEYFMSMPISLMSIFPPKDMLQALRSAGISEVAFNIEIADEQLAQKHMKGKYNGKKQFYDNMKKAIEIFGVGNVRSALLVGLDNKTALLNMVQEMANEGIIPCLSAIRALPNAQLKLDLHPSNAYLCEVYKDCVHLLCSSESRVKQLGPICKRCGNNMLII